MQNQEVVSRLVQMVKEETRITLEILRLLLEVERRKIYLELEYESLIVFAIKHLGYSEGSAHRRIAAMRLIRIDPTVEGKIKSGKLNICTAAKAQSFSRKNKIDPKAAIAAVEGKSTRAAERSLLELAPQALPREKERALSATHTEIRIVIDAELKAQLDQLKNLLAHKSPEMTYLELFKYLAALGLKKHDPAKRSSATSAPKLDRASAEVAPAVEDVSPDTKPVTATLKKSEEASVRTSAAKANTRYIPAELRRAIWRRDGGCCTFQNGESGKRCGGRYMLEIDHVIPWAVGGPTSFENLRLLCRAHNQYLAELHFPDSRRANSAHVH